MKKILTITLMLAMMIIITACGQQQDKQGSTESNTAETTVKESEISTTTANETETSAESNKSNKLSINIEALNKIEAKDTFDVKISGVELFSYTNSSPSYAQENSAYSPMNLLDYTYANFSTIDLPQITDEVIFITGREGRTNG